MDINNIVDLISNYGMAFVLMAYFLIKDWKFNEATLNTLASIREVLVKLQTLHGLEDGAEK